MYDPGWIRRRNSGNYASAAWGVVGPLLAFDAATITDTSSAGTVATAVGYSLGVPTIAASAATTYTIATTLYIAGPPAAGAGVTLSAAHNLWLAGTVGSVAFGTTTPGNISGTLGAITVTASGTNQNITLTPSGTGAVALSGSGAAATGLLSFPAATTAAGGITFGTDVNLYRSAANELSFNNAGGGAPAFVLRESGTRTASFATATGVAYLSSDSAQPLVLRYNSTEVFRLNSTTQAQFAGTNTLRFGATANATIGVSADTTAGVFTFTTPSGGTFLFTGGGATFASGNVTFTNQIVTSGSIVPNGGTVMTFVGGISATTKFAFTDQTNVSTSGTFNHMRLSPTYNQASGSAANTDLLINRTETAVGSGAQLLVDLQVATVSKFKVSNIGVITAANLAGAGTRTVVADANGVLSAP